MKKQLAILLCALVAIAGLAACSAESRLESVIEKANKELPKEIAGGISMTKVELVGDYAVYTVEIDDNVIPMSELEGAKSEMKDAMMMALDANDDEDSKEFKELMKEANKGYKFKFVGMNSGTGFDIAIAPSEM